MTHAITITSAPIGVVVFAVPVTIAQWQQLLEDDMRGALSWAPDTSAWTEQKWEAVLAAPAMYLTWGCKRAGYRLPKGACPVGWVDAHGYRHEAGAPMPPQNILELAASFIETDGIAAAWEHLATA